jgi:ABC-type branched-subunit amino acid transport system substrate-binding protein
MKKRTLFQGVLFCLVGFVVVITSATVLAANEGVTDTSVKIGSILDQTGPIAYYGKVSAQAIIASAKEINSKGGINGRKIIFASESDEYNPAKHLAAAKKLVEKDKILCFTNNLGVANAIALLPYLQKKKVPSIAIMGSSSKLIGQPYVYLMGTGYDWQGQCITDFIANDLKKKDASIGFIVQADESGRDYLKGAQRQMKKYPGLKTALVEEVPRRALDVSATILKVKSANPDVVVIAGPHVGNVAKLKKEAFKLGWKPTFVISVHAADVAFPYLAGPAAEGDYVLALYPLLDSGDPVVKEYATTVKKAFPKAKLNTIAFSSYLHFKVTADAIQRAGRDLTRERLVDVLEILRDPQLKNVYIPLGYGRVLGGTKAFFSQVQNGKFVQVRDPQPPK